MIDLLDAFPAFVALCITFVAFGVALCGCAAVELVSSRRDLARREADFLASQGSRHGD